MQTNNFRPICALATPAGHSAIAVVRMSGEGSFEIIKSACPGLNKKPIQSHTSRLTKILAADKSLIDEAVVSFFEKGRSYTGEESVEISVHGSPYIAKRVLDRLIECGAKTANPGEFTYRAFLNSRLDLVQAEGVLSMIESDSDQSLKIGQRQIEGDVSDRFKKLTSDLTWCLAHIEASIDFSTEGLETADPIELRNKLKGVQKELLSLKDSYQSGRILKEGFNIALIGKPNSGKSSLLNLFVQSDRAIVSPIAGTTRDVVEGETLFSGVKIKFSDTAGVRSTADQIEQLGIQRSILVAKGADAIFYVVDGASAWGVEDQQRIHELAQFSKLFVLVNKVDLMTAEQKITWQKVLLPDGPTDQASGDRNLKDPGGKGPMFVSALDSGSRERVFGDLLRPIIESSDRQGSAVLATARQFELCTKAHLSLGAALSDLEQDIGAEFVSQRLKDALISLQKILGEHYDDQILDRVFKEFCLGK